MDRIELGAAQLFGYPQLQQAFAVQCVDGGGRELAVFVGELRFGVEKWRQHLGPFGQDRSFGQCVAERHGNGPLSSLSLVTVTARVERMQARRLGPLRSWPSSACCGRR